MEQWDWILRLKTSDSLIDLVSALAGDILFYQSPIATESATKGQFSSPNLPMLSYF
jgi:hypothetical protein